MLQRSEVAAVRWLPFEAVRDMYATSHADIVPLSDFASYSRLFEECERVCAAAAPAAAAAAAPEAAR